MQNAYLVEQWLNLKLLFTGCSYIEKIGKNSYNSSS